MLTLEIELFPTCQLILIVNLPRGSESWDSDGSSAVLTSALLHCHSQFGALLGGVVWVEEVSLWGYPSALPLCTVTQLPWKWQLSCLMPPTRTPWCEPSKHEKHEPHKWVFL